MNDVIGKIAHTVDITLGYRSYVVCGWFLDSNGCIKTYGKGYLESFYDNTYYS
jgi:hypothetical protein